LKAHREAEQAEKNYDAAFKANCEYQERLAELQKQNTTLHSINNEWEKDYAILESQNARLKKQVEFAKEALNRIKNPEEYKTETKRE
jgi:hypothetical protein